MTIITVTVPFLFTDTIQNISGKYNAAAERVTVPHHSLKHISSQKMS